MNKILKYLLIVLSALLLISTLSSAQDSVELAVYANATVYNNPAYDSVSLVEFPFSVNREEFEFYQPDSTDSRFLARIFAQVELLNTSGFPIDSSSTYFSVSANTLEESQQPGFRIFNKLKMFAHPGIYSARITIIDVVSKNKGRYYIDQINITPAQTELIQLGGVNVAYQLEYVGEDGIKSNPLTYKNGYSIYVNPISVFSHTDSIVYLYGEVYNLSYNDQESSKYNLSLNILNEDGDLYKLIGSRSKPKPGTSAVFVESFSIADIPIGNYDIQIIAADLNTRTIDTLLYPMHIISPTDIMAKAVKLQEYDDPYFQLSLKEKRELVTYMLFENDLKTLKSLEDVGQDNFLTAFWRMKDNSPETPANEYRLEMIQRYRFCLDNYSTNDLKTNGWLTDRARIYMKHGQWEEIDDHEAPRIGNSFVVWYYHSIEGGLSFIFEDQYGDDDYRLVHSNAIEEVYSNEWAERLRSGFTDFLEQ